MEILGYKHSDVLGKPFSDFVHPEDMNRVAPEFSRLYRNEPAASRLEVRCRCADGSYRWVAWSATVPPDDDLLYAIGHDIAGLKELEKALVGSKEQLQLIIDTVPAFVFYKDTENRLVRVNKAFADSMGLKADEMEGKSGPELFPADQAEKYLQDDLEVIESGSPKMGIIEPYDTPGGTRWARTDKIPLYDDEGAAVGIIGFAVDITERIRAEEALQVLNNELEGFAHTVSHDLRGSLTVIGASCEMLSNLLKTPGADRMLEDVASMAEMINRNYVKAAALIDDILELAEAGQVPREVSVVAVADIVKEVLFERQAAIDDRSISVRVDDEMGSVTGSRTHIYQVFSNLVDNAIRHNNADNPVVEVLYKGSDAGRHRYVVRDNGPGIPVEDLDEVFLPFFKGPTGGAGIGLSTVKRVIDLYGGDIRAYNENGACFEFVLTDYVE